MTKQPIGIFKFLNIQTSEYGSVLFPFIKIVFGPYAEFINKIKAFIYIGSIYSFMVALIYLLGNQSVFCNITQNSSIITCNYNVWLYITIRVIVLYFISMFCVRYYQAVWQNKHISLSFIILPQKTDIKSFLWLICFILINSLAGLSWYFLQIRVPNPDWRIELVYFGFVGSGFLIPFICLRFYSVWASVWSGNTVPSVAGIWKKTRGNGFRLIIGLAVWFFIFVFLFSACIRKLSYWLADINYIKMFSGELLFSIIMMAIISFWVNNCGIQKYILDKESADDSGKTN
ncbi:MAG: hypothetical protein E7012_06715 [Alphaproteobacteria bacterium]|nr:hypothetical protein [Alphaproteobacteria bacterium]